MTGSPTTVETQTTEESQTGDTQSASPALKRHRAIGELNDQGYIRWLKGTRMLQLTTGVLRKVCLVEITKVHAELQKTCGKTCSARCSDVHGSNNNWSIVCPDNVCSKWLTAVVAMRTTSKTKLAMRKADILRWLEEPWQLANVFIENPQPQSVDPSETDASGILQLMRNCIHFRKVVDTTKVQAVRILKYSSISTLSLWSLRARVV